MNYEEALREGIRLLRAHEVPDAATDAHLLIEHVSGLDRTGYFLHSRDEMPAGKQKEYFRLIAERGKRIRGLCPVGGEDLPRSRVGGQDSFPGAEDSENTRKILFSHF